jgi:hypothetical protein
MKSQTRVAVLILAGFLTAAGAPADPGGGGSGGGSGHGGGSSGGHGGGHFSGRSSGHSGGGGFGHAIGHSFGRMFGRHGKASDSAHELEPPVAGAALLHGKVVQLPGPRPAFFPVGRGFPHHRHHEFPFGDRFLFFPPGAGFGFGGCWDFGLPRYGLFGGEFDCSAGGLFFDPLFIAGFSGDYLSAQTFLPFNNEEFDDAPSEPRLASPAESNAEPRSGAAGFTEYAGQPQNAAANKAASAGIPKDERPVTLVQLLDGAMYGLVDYWVEDGQLHYTTTYGGQDVVGLDRVDMVKTVELNTGRGIQFVPHPKAASQ